MTWTDDDPGQGDPAIIAGLAADLQDQADDAATAARQLRALHDNTTNSVWRGDAADAFRHRIGALPAHLDKLHASYADAAAGMRTYAAAVTQIADDATAAKRLIAAAQADQHTALAQQAAWIAPVNPTTGHPEPAAINPHDETVAAATASVNRATVALNHLGDDRRAADHRVISSLHQAHSAGMKNKSWFHRLLDTASHALAKLTVVLLVIAVVAVVVLAIVQPELIPGLLLLAGQALSGLSAAQLAVDGTRKAMGDNVSWGSLAIDALGALPGAGELAKAGALGEKTLAAATRITETAASLRTGASAFARSVGGDVGATRYVVDMSVGANTRAVTGIADAVMGAEASETTEAILVRAIESVNPTHGEFNCANCAVATDATLAGHPSAALNYGPQLSSVLEERYGSRFLPVTCQEDIEELLRATGDGSRGIVAGGRGTEDGHVFNAVNVGGIVYFLDGQSGAKASFEGYGSLHFLRTK